MAYICSNSGRLTNECQCRRCVRRNMDRLEAAFQRAEADIKGDQVPPADSDMEEVSNDG